MSLPSVDSRPALLAFVDSDPSLAVLRDEVARRDDGDEGHGLDHALRVAQWTATIGAECRPPLDARQAVAAGLLHDLVNVPKSSPDRARASQLSADAAAPVLEAAGFAEAEIAEICGAIRDHSYSRGAVPESDLGRALQDADRLEALGALGICRCISTGTKMEALYFDVDDPWAARRALDDRAYSIDHFATKLLRLTATMQTARGRVEAERRSRLLRLFVAELAHEIGAPVPAAWWPAGTSSP